MIAGGRLYRKSVLEVLGSWGEQEQHQEKGKLGARMFTTKTAAHPFRDWAAHCTSICLAALVAVVIARQSRCSPTVSLHITHPHFVSYSFSSPPARVKVSRPISTSLEHAVLPLLQLPSFCQCTFEPLPCPHCCRETSPQLQCQCCRPPLSRLRARARARASRSRLSSCYCELVITDLLLSCFSSRPTHPPTLLLLHLNFRPPALPPPPPPNTHYNTIVFDVFSSYSAT